MLTKSKSLASSKISLAIMPSSTIRILAGVASGDRKHYSPSSTLKNVKNSIECTLLNENIMLLEIKLNQSELEMKILQNPALEKRKNFVGKVKKIGKEFTPLFKGGVDFEKARYYHDLSGVLTPLEVVDIIKNGFIIKDGTAIYGELLTGLISCLDKLLIRSNIDIKLLKSYKILSNLGQDSSSYKIASAFVEGLKIRF